MKFTTVAGAMLLASTAIAAPSGTMKEKLQARLDKRRAERHLKRSLAIPNTLRPLAVGATSNSDTIVIPASNETEYSSNWSGGVIVGTDITEVTGEFTIPTVTAPSGASSNTEYGASAWVGIDGDTCTTAILQTGIEFFVENGETSYAAWYEWYPDSSVEFSDFDVAPGDVIKATVVATSTTGGTATIDNITTGKSTSHTFSNMGSVGSLCLKNAEWIVEDFEEGDSLIPFADYDSITFTDASYVTDGTTTGVSDATVLDMENSNDQITSSCTIESSSEIKCTYE